MTAAAFKGTYSDFKLIKTRGVVSISFEIPVEQAQVALDVLGGMPVAATEVWCAVARLEPTKEVVPPDTNEKGRPDTPPRQKDKQPSDRAKQAFRDMRMPNQAGMLCHEVPFQKFLLEKHIKYARGTEPTMDDKLAADCVRLICGVGTRSDIRPRTPSGDRWTRLVDEYRTWMHMPELT